MELIYFWEVHMNTEKNLEQKLRRALAREGYQLCKSRARNWSIDNQQGYMIVDVSTNACVRGPRFDESLDDIHDFVDWLYS